MHLKPDSSCVSLVRTLNLNKINSSVPFKVEFRIFRFGVYGLAIQRESLVIVVFKESFIGLREQISGSHVGCAFLGTNEKKWADCKLLTPLYTATHWVTKANMRKR